MPSGPSGPAEVSAISASATPILRWATLLGETAAKARAIDTRRFFVSCNLKIYFHMSSDIYGAAEAARFEFLRTMLRRNSHHGGQASVDVAEGALPQPDCGNLGSEGN